MAEATSSRPETVPAPQDNPRELDLAVGGQAVIEGVMMRSPTATATAVRTPDGRIVIRKKPFRSVVRRFRFLNLPVLRGGIHLIETLALGIDTLMFSADQAMSEERVASQQGRLRDTLLMWGTVIFAFALSLGLFFYIPLVLTDLLGVTGNIWFNVIDGIIRVILFFLYLWGISKLPDMARVFEYHGAEHKSIHAFEHGRELTPAGARPFTTLHPRCGTSFLFFVMLISIVVFVFVGRPESIAERLERLAFVPLIGGLAYEAIKLSGRYGATGWLKPVIWPGLMLQKITTSEPDDQQLSVGMAALKAVLTPEVEDFKPRVYYDLPASPWSSEPAATAADAAARPLDRTSGEQA